VNNKKYKYWLAVVGDQQVQFSDLPHMIATALHPEGGIAYGAARLNLDDELKRAVRDGLLKVRNPVGLGFHTHPHGNALQRAVLIPDADLEPFLNERGIELRITPHGNGPEFWTLENAAAAIQEQLNWHDDTRREFQDQMQEAVKAGALIALDPHTCLPSRSEEVRTYWEYVTPDTVNAWLTDLKAPYRWSKPETSIRPAPNDDPEYFVEWYDQTLDAAAWLGYGAMTPREAAMLLCELNPHDEAVNPLNVANLHTNPEDYKKLLRKFEDSAATNSVTRVLTDWLDIAESAGLRYHPWLGKYLQLKKVQPVAEEPAQALPLPLTTSNMAFCLDGIRWSESEWKKKLGTKPAWVKGSIAIPGQQGVSETHWNPVILGAVLITRGLSKTNTIRARFQSKAPLKPWLDAWKTYEADHFE
jgi:hypothetical protein